MEFILVAIVGLATPLSLLSLLFTLDLVVVLADVALFLVEMLLPLLPGLAQHRLRATPPRDAETSDSSPIRRKNPWPRRILLSALAMFALLLAGTWFVDRFHFEPFMRWGAARMEKSAGVVIDFKTVSGSIWTGELHFTGLSMRRDSHPLSTFDIAVDKADMRVSMIRLLWRRLRMESLSIEGVRGTWTRRAKAERSGASRTFSISDFRLDDFRIDYHNLLAGSAARPVEIRVDTMRSINLSSGWLILQLLFLSGAEGSIDGSPYLIQHTTKTPLDATTIWKCEGMPLPVLASLVGKPFDVFEGGNADVFIENSLYFLPELELNMDWSVILTNFRAAVPPGASLREKAVWLPVMAFLNQKREKLDLNYKVKLTGKGGSIATSDDLESALDLEEKIFGMLKRKKNTEAR